MKNILKDIYNKTKILYLYHLQIINFTNSFFKIEWSKLHGVKFYLFHLLFLFKNL